MHPADIVRRTPQIFATNHTCSWVRARETARGSETDLGVPSHQSTKERRGYVDKVVDNDADLHHIHAAAQISVCAFVLQSGASASGTHALRSRQDLDALNGRPVLTYSHLEGEDALDCQELELYMQQAQQREVGRDCDNRRERTVRRKPMQTKTLTAPAGRGKHAREDVTSPDSRFLPNTRCARVFPIPAPPLPHRVRCTPTACAAAGIPGVLTMVARETREHPFQSSLMVPQGCSLTPVGCCGDGTEECSP